jgi:hypothetical protein
LERRVQGGEEEHSNSYCTRGAAGGYVAVIQQVSRAGEAQVHTGTTEAQQYYSTRQRELTARPEES